MSVCIYTLRIRQAKRIFSTQRYIVIDACLPLSHSPAFYHKRYDLKKKKVIESKMCVLVFSATFALKHFSFQEELIEIWSQMYIGINVNKVWFKDFKET